MLYITEVKKYIGIIITVIIKKTGSSTFSRPLIKLCNNIETKPITTINHNFFQLNKNIFVESNGLLIRNVY